jgi:hypothetical protein
VIDPEKLPDIQPDKRKFWLLRFLTVALFFVGLAMVVYGGAIGALAYWGTKGGNESGRLIEALSHVLLALVGGFFAMAVGQVFRVVIAIEENTRLVAFHTRPRPRPPEPPRRTMPAPQAEREQVRL